MEKDKVKLKFKRIWQNNIYILKMLHRASPGRIFWEIFISVCSSLSWFILWTFILRYAINSFQAGVPYEKILIVVIILVFASNIFGRIIPSIYWELISPLMSLRANEYMSKIMFHKACEAELACFENPDFYDKYVKAMQESNSRSDQVLQTLSNLVDCIVRFTANAFLIFYIDPLLMLFTFAPLIIFWIFGRTRKRLGFESEMKHTEVKRRLNYAQRTFYLSDYAKEMRLTNVWRLMLAKFNKSIQDAVAIVKQYGFKMAVLGAVVNILRELILTVGVTIYSTYRTLVAGKMKYGDCIVVISTINQVSDVLENVSDILLTFNQHALFIENLRYFLDYEPKIPKNENGLSAICDKCDIEIRNLSFRYDGCDSYALKNINISIKNGEKIALVGHNGAGKSTLIKLLLRLYVPTRGSITLNGEDISRYKLDEYRNLFGVVFQDYKVFALSVSENVLGREFTPDDEEGVISALRNSGAYDKVMTLKNGLDTVLTREFDDEGAVLSGGEFQKISIARIFTKENKCVILDEPSSALDPIAEYNMYENMMRACKDASVVFISHRLSSAVLADRVYMMEDGEVIEAGTHRELMESNGKYADMFRKQAENYVDIKEMAI